MKKSGVEEEEACFLGLLSNWLASYKERIGCCWGATCSYSFCLAVATVGVLIDCKSQAARLLAMSTYRPVLHGHNLSSDRMGERMNQGKSTADLLLTWGWCRAGFGFGLLSIWEEEVEGRGWTPLVSSDALLQPLLLNLLQLLLLPLDASKAAVVAWLSCCSYCHGPSANHPRKRERK